MLKVKGDVETERKVSSSVILPSDFAHHKNAADEHNDIILYKYTLGDPVALQCKWTAFGEIDHSQSSLIEVSELSENCFKLATSKNDKILIAFGIPTFLFLIGMLALVFDFNYDPTYRLYLIYPIMYYFFCSIVLTANIFILCRMQKDIMIDLSKDCIYSFFHLPGLKKVKKIALISNIHAIQVLKYRQIRWASLRKRYQEDDIRYEINFIYKDGKRHRFLNFGIKIATKVAEILKVPLWDATHIETKLEK